MTPEEFKRVRQKTGINTTEFGKLLGPPDQPVSRWAVESWEMGRRAISGPVALLVQMIDDGRISTVLSSGMFSAESFRGASVLIGGIASHAGEDKR